MLFVVNNIVNLTLTLSKSEFTIYIVVKLISIFNF